MIKATELKYEIKNKPLIENISLTFDSNQISMIVGPNGAGKSTLIQLLSQQLACTSGEIEFFGRPIREISSTKMAKKRAVLSQNTAMAFPLMVKDVVMMGRYPHFTGKPRQRDEEICMESMELFNISKMKERNYLTLSGGEQQRVHFARVIAQIWPDREKTTKVLMLDEPLTYLDIYYQYDFLRVIKQLIQDQEMIVIGVVHDLNLAYQFADKIVLMDNGKLVQHGNPNEVFTPENIQKVFKLKSMVLKDNQGNKHLNFC
jgi:iron complex transport system ATP-binding protein